MTCFNAEIWCWNNVEIWRWNSMLKSDVASTLKSDVSKLKSDIVSTLKSDVVWTLKYDVSTLKYDVVSTLCLKQVVILNLPLGIVHSGMRQKESLLSMQSSPRDCTLVLATAWERNTYTSTRSILGLGFITHANNKLQHGHVFILLLEMK